MTAPIDPTHLDQEAGDDRRAADQEQDLVVSLHSLSLRTRSLRNSPPMRSRAHVIRTVSTWWWSDGCERPSPLVGATDSAFPILQGQAPFFALGGPIRNSQRAGPKGPPSDRLMRRVKPSSNRPAHPRSPFGDGSTRGAILAAA